MHCVKTGCCPLNPRNEGKGLMDDREICLGGEEGSSALWHFRLSKFKRCTVNVRPAARQYKLQHWTLSFNAFAGHRTDIMQLVLINSTVLLAPNQSSGINLTAKFSVPVCACCRNSGLLPVTKQMPHWQYLQAYIVRSLSPLTYKKSFDKDRISFIYLCICKIKNEEVFEVESFIQIHHDWNVKEPTSLLILCVSLIKELDLLCAQACKQRTKQLQWQKKLNDH